VRKLDLFGVGNICILTADHSNSPP